MASPVLFSTGATPAASGASRNLVEFKAGKMEMRDRMVHPLPRKGLVYLRQSPDDSLMHFCWRDRTTGATEDDLILFPDDCEFKRVKECTTGRVYVLKMKSSNKKMFFWMQESKTDRDDEYCKKINELLNNPPRPGSDSGSGAGNQERELQQLFNSMSQEQIAHLLSSNGVNLGALLGSTGRSPSSNSGASASSTASTTNSAPTSAPTSATSGAAANLSTGAAAAEPNMNELRALISGALMEGNEEEVNALMAATLGQGGTPNTAQAGASSGQRDTRQPLIDLSTAVNSESLAHLLSDKEFLRQIEPHLPPINSVEGQSAPVLTDDDRKAQFADTIRSSQFRSSLSQFCVALQSGQLGPLMSQFGLSQECVDAANLGNLTAFVRALDAQMRPSGGSTDSSGSAQNEPRDQS